MAVLAGKSGSVKLGANTVAELDTWSMTVGFNLVDTASFGDSWEEKTATLGRATGTCSGRFDNTDTNGAVALQTAALAGTTVSLSLYEDSAKYYSMTAFVELTQDASVTGTVNCSFSFTSSGAVTAN